VQILGSGRGGSNQTDVLEDKGRSLAGVGEGLDEVFGAVLSRDVAEREEGIRAVGNPWLTRDGVVDGLPCFGEKFRGGHTWVGGVENIGAIGEGNCQGLAHGAIEGDGG
jgi:hypothetical protein